MKVGIVGGAGRVGATTAYTLLVKGMTDKIALVDVATEKAMGEALDLKHGLCFTPHTEIVAGGYDKLADSDVVVITAGIPRKPGDSRLDLAAKNIKMFQEIIPQISEVNKNAILFVVGNPVDVTTYVTHKISGFDPSRVFGLGNVLDTARLSNMLGQHFNVDPGNVNAYMLGEHGDTQFPLLSSANIGGVKMSDMPGYSQDEVLEKIGGLRGSAMQVISSKGFTSSAVALSIVEVLDSIRLNKSKVHPISVLLEDHMGVSDVCMSVPSIVDRTGVRKILKVSLDPLESEQFMKSAETLKTVLKQNLPRRLQVDLNPGDPKRQRPEDTTKRKITQ